MGALTRFNLKLLIENNYNLLYETGTGQGNSATHALSSGMKAVHSIESHPPLFEANRERLAHIPNLFLSLGDSENFLKNVVSEETSGRIFFLDAHFFGGTDFNPTEIGYLESSKHPLSFPLGNELEILLTKDISNDWIIIDDARLYVSGPFELGECPDFAKQHHRYEEISIILEKFKPTHEVTFSRLDHGYWVLSPRLSLIYPPDIINIYPTDLAGGYAGALSVFPNINGVTSISILRRISDNRFSTRYFQGYGLDIGPGNDSLALYREFFPLVNNIVTYDLAQGNAQKLNNINDESFDFVYSSHCLEHLHDAHEALINWIRVVKPGGYLIVQVPDEDLYEKGIWPSVHNSDHKLTFTINKENSWSPVSINILDLLKNFSNKIKIIQLGLEDKGYRYLLNSPSFDQTRTPIAECGIEFILKKL
jgi:SAM-dependent methyltransferase